MATTNGSASAAETGRKLFPEERRAAVLGMLSRQPKVLVNELAEKFGVSTFTVRADLDELESEGKLRRCHGGAMSVAKTMTVEDYDKRLSHASDAKSAIGAAAAQFVEAGDSIIVDTGTTTLELVKHLVDVPDLTIVTNDFEISAFVERNIPRASLLFLGGWVRSGYRYAYSVESLRSVERLHVDKAFLSANGMTIEDGFTSESFEQAQLKSAYAHASTETIMLIDTGKVGKVTFSGFVGFDQVDAIVTERPFDTATAEAIQAKHEGVELISAR